MKEGEQYAVVAVRRDSEGRNVAFRLSNGSTIDYTEAIDLAHNGQLANCNAFRGKDGDLHLRSNADGDASNNLDSLPTF